MAQHPPPTLFWNATIIYWSPEDSDLDVIRNGSLLVRNSRIEWITRTPGPKSAPEGTTLVDLTGHILAPGFVDIHKHGWQTCLKTMAPNTTLTEYFMRYSPEASRHMGMSREDVYVAQMQGLYEGINAGVTTVLDFANHCWDAEIAEAGLDASIATEGRVFWCFGFQNPMGGNDNEFWSIAEQIACFRKLAEQTKVYRGETVTLGVAYDGFGLNPNKEEVKAILDAAKEVGASVMTTHHCAGPWGVNNGPSDLVDLPGFFDAKIPIVFAHGAYMSAKDRNILREKNAYLAITPESEMHYGHGNPQSHMIQDQAALGIDTHLTFSTDILTQARLWLQTARARNFEAVTDSWRIPRRTSQTVNQAFLLATRQGGLALGRSDIGVITPGAVADLVVWRGDSPALLGFNDPVAAIMLHASVGDIDSVMINGKFLKRDGKITWSRYNESKEWFLESAMKLQKKWAAVAKPDDKMYGPSWGLGQSEYADPRKVNLHPLQNVYHRDKEDFVWDYNVKEELMGKHNHVGGGMVNRNRDRDRDEMDRDDVLYPKEAEERARKRMEAMTVGDGDQMRTGDVSASEEDKAAYSRRMSSQAEERRMRRDSGLSFEPTAKEQKSMATANYNYEWSGGMVGSP